MTKIVRESYPASKLSQELRQGFAPSDTVRVTIDSAALRPAQPLGKVRSDSEKADALVLPQGQASEENERFKRMRRNNYKTIDDVVAYVRSLRD